MPRFARVVLALLAGAPLFASSHAFAVVPNVLPGYELLTTVTGPTIGGVPFAGVPLGTFDFGPPAGVQNTYNTDTIIKRLNTVTPGSLPGSGSTPTELVALQLVTTVPVDLGLGTDFYYLTLQSTRGGPASTGTMNISFDAAGLPTVFDATLHLFFDIRKGSTSGSIFTTGDYILPDDPSSWSRTPPPGAVTIPDVNQNLNGTSDGADFWAPNIRVELWPEGSRSVATASLPEPASLSLLLLAAPALLRRRRPGTY